MPRETLAALTITILMFVAPLASATSSEGPEDPIPDPADTVETTFGEDPGELVPVDTSQLPFDEAVLEDMHPVYPYYTWYTLTAELFDIAETYPGITTLYSAGQSNLGFDLWVLEIANFDDQDKIPLEDREVIYLDGGHHANEDLGVTMTMLWADFLTSEHETNETAQWIVENRHTILLPLVNADGNHMNSRHNANAVDLNRNYPQGWGQVEGDNSGPHPLSEPETQAVYGMLETFQPDYVNSFHTGIELMLYPWGYTTELPPDYQVYDRICKEIGEPDPDFCGPVATTIYPASGGTIESSYGHFGSISFSYELDDEQFVPGSLEDPRDRMERYWDALEHAFLNVEKYGAHPVLTEVDAEGAPGGEATVKATVENQGYGNLTSADITLSLPGASQETVTTGFLAPNETTTVTLTSPLDEDANLTEIELIVTYDELVQASPTEEDTVQVPVDMSGGSISVLQEGADEVAPQGEEGEASTVPGFTLASIVATLAASLAIMRHPR